MNHREPSHRTLYQVSKFASWFSLSTNLILPHDINLLLTEREGRTGECWPEVVSVRTVRSEVRTKTTEGQYSKVRLKQAKLARILLYGTRVRLVY